MLTLHLFVIAILISSDTVPIEVYTFHAFNSWHWHAACLCLPPSGFRAFASFVNSTGEHCDTAAATGEWANVYRFIAAARFDADTMFENKQNTANDISGKKWNRKKKKSHTHTGVMSTRKIILLSATRECKMISKRIDSFEVNQLWFMSTFSGPLSLSLSRSLIEWWYVNKILASCYLTHGISAFRFRAQEKWHEISLTEHNEMRLRASRAHKHIQRKRKKEKKNKRGT